LLSSSANVVPQQREPLAEPTARKSANRKRPNATIPEAARSEPEPKAEKPIKRKQPDKQVKSDIPVTPKPGSVGRKKTLSSDREEVPPKAENLSEAVTTTEPEPERELAVGA
jgi:hypothetical protein